MKKLKLAFIFLFATAFSSCDIATDLLDLEEASGTVYYWLASDADTYVECLNIVAPCAGEQIDRSTNPGLVVAHTPGVIKRSYINFPMPIFPDGTVIEEAYLELYHSGTNEDGKSDDINLSVTRVKPIWNAATMTFQNQPIPVESGEEFKMDLKSDDWSGTSNMAFSLQKDIVENRDLEGFVVFIRNKEPGYEKGFHSGNHSSRSLDNLGMGPRLMLKVTLPQGSSTSSVRFNNNHFDGSSGSFFGVQYRSGINWPADWDVAILK